MASTENWVFPHVKEPNNITKVAFLLRVNINYQE